MKSSNSMKANKISLIKIIILIILCLTLPLTIIFSYSVFYTNFLVESKAFSILSYIFHIDNDAGYNVRIRHMNIFENSLEDAYPQTAIHDIVEEYYDEASDLYVKQDGATEKKKKAIIIGYDGYRVDCLKYCPSGTGTKRILAEGGKAYYSYAGGAKYPEEIKHMTSTQPGWSSILTGNMAYEMGITTDEGNRLDIKYPTLVRSLVEDNKVNSTSFYTSYEDNLITDGVYYDEMQYSNKKGLKANYKLCSDDDEVIDNVLDNMSSESCDDFIFLILEEADYVGHHVGRFSNNSPSYRKAVRKDEENADKIIDAIREREERYNEDWLIIITTDHGGNEHIHGGSELRTRYTWMVVEEL